MDDVWPEPKTELRDLCSMIAIGGAVGSGLIIGSGSALSKAGPVGLLIGYSLVGLICFTVSCAPTSCPFKTADVLVNKGHDCSRRGKRPRPSTSLIQRVDRPFRYHRWQHGCQTSEVSQVMRKFWSGGHTLSKKCSSSIWPDTVLVSSTMPLDSQPVGTIWQSTS